jgi:hypothetical protein
MSFTYSGGTTFSSIFPKDGMMNEYTGSAMFIESGLPSFRIVNTSTLVTGVTSTTLSAPIGMTMITPTSALIVSSAVSTVDYIEIASGYRTNVSGGSAAPNITAKSQIVAGDTTSGVAFGSSSTSQTLVRMTSGESVSTITNFGYSNDIAQTIILKAPGRWLVGTSYGYIHEIDINGTIQDTCKLPLALSAGRNPSTGSLTALPIYCMAYDNNMLLVGTDVATFLLDWSTKTVINSNSSQSITSASNILFCTGASGETIASHGTAVNATTNSLYELDFTIQPIQVRDQLYLDFSTPVYCLSLSNNYATGFSLDTSGHMRVFTISARSTTTRTVSTLTPNTQAGLTFISDPGVGLSQVLLDTYANLPGTYRVLTGQTIMELIKVGAGAVAQWDCSRYST